MSLASSNEVARRIFGRALNRANFCCFEQLSALCVGDGVVVLGKRNDGEEWCEKVRGT